VALDGHRLGRRPEERPLREEGHRMMFGKKRRCRTCGNTWHAPEGDRSRCPYTLMHERALRGLGKPLANDHPTAVKLRSLAMKFTKHKPEPGDPFDKKGQRLNRELLEAARLYGRVAAHAEALLKEAEQ
jgi:hypothetical protein